MKIFLNIDKLVDVFKILALQMKKINTINKIKKPRYISKTMNEICLLHGIIILQKYFGFIIFSDKI